jgi:hypothetical protein
MSGEKQLAERKCGWGDCAVKDGVDSCAARSIDIRRSIVRT